MGAYTAFEVTPCGLAPHKGGSYFCDKMPDGRDHTHSSGYIPNRMDIFFLSGNRNSYRTSQSGEALLVIAV